VARQGVKGAEVQTSREDAVTSAAAGPEEKPKECRYTNRLKKQLAGNSDDRGAEVRVSLESRILSSPQRPDRLRSPPRG
jgi:hypothetical protein